MPPIPKTKDARIKIAILDTGVDMTDSFIGLKSNRTRIQYKSFVPGDSSKNPEDLVGHGTHVTGLLLKVARNADIFVARITKNASFEDPDQIAEVR
jgi:subtilisin family serine protease